MFRMSNRIAVIAALAGAGLLSACDETASGGGGGGEAQRLAEIRCSEAVAAQTNPDVVVLRSTPLASGEVEVVVGVGLGSGPRAPWRCIGAPDGSTRAVQFMGSEGAA